MRVLLAILVVLLAAPAVGAAQSQKARVWLVDESPTTVRGVGFGSSERVTVVVSAGKRVLRGTARSTESGAFTKRWRASIAGGCHSTFVTAKGESGIRAVYRVVANDCAYPDEPPGGKL